MATRVTEGARHPRFARLGASPLPRAPLLSLNLKQKRDCSQSTQGKNLLVSLKLANVSFNNVAKRPNQATKTRAL